MTGNLQHSNLNALDEDRHIFLATLHERLRAEFLNLPQEQQNQVLEIPAEKVKQRKIAISLLDSHLRGYSPREKWTNGLDQMVMLVDNPGHFLRLILDQRGEDIEDLVDLILDFEDGSHNDERYTDPARYDLLRRGAETFRKKGYHKMDYWGAMDQAGLRKSKLTIHDPLPLGQEQPKKTEKPPLQP